MRGGEFFAAVKQFSERPPAPGSAWAQTAPEPNGAEWPEVVEPDGAAVLASVENFITRYVILPEAACLPIALWAAGTHLFESFDTFPYLCLLSPQKRCGKTRLQEVLELLCARPWRGTSPTEAALFRYIETRKPTLLLDEVESLGKKNRSERDEAVSAVLNCGYRRGATVPRCVGGGHEIQVFNVYCPKSFAAIGRLGDTLLDRSIVVRMQRKSADENAERFIFARAKSEAEPIRKAVESLAKRLAGDVSNLYAKLPDIGLPSDRDSELFAPLFALCGVLAPDRAGEFEGCARTLCVQKSSDDAEDTLPLKLIEGVCSEWPDGQDAWLSRGILPALKSIEDAPWQAEIELTPRKLARMLRPFDIFVRDVRTPEGKGKGYVLSEFRRAASRYIPQRAKKSEASGTICMDID